MTRKSLSRIEHDAANGSNGAAKGAANGAHAASPEPTIAAPGTFKLSTEEGKTIAALIEPVSIHKNAAADLAFQIHLTQKQLAETLDKAQALQNAAQAKLVEIALAKGIDAKTNKINLDLPTLTVTHSPL